MRYHCVVNAMTHRKVKLLSRICTIKDHWLVTTLILGMVKNNYM